MLKSLNFKDLKQQRIDDPDAMFYIISRDKLNYVKFDNIFDCPVLAPSDKLERMMRLGDLTESAFNKRYAYELHNSPVVVALLGHLRTQAKNQNVYLVENSKESAELLLDLLDKI
jgi:uncharacterized protein YeaO (DUF488 family)